MSRRVISWRARAGIVLAVGAAVLAAAVFLRVWATDPRLRHALARRGVVAVWSEDGFADLDLEGTRLVRAVESPALASALRGRDASKLLAALRTMKVDALWVQASRSAAGTGDISLLDRLADHGTAPGLHGLYVARAGALYALDAEGSLSARDRDALAAVARALLGGAEPPSVSSFPEPLRAVRPVEVMVLLRSGERARLWRSARGSSIARALITAATVARKRWTEREQAMGGPIDAALSRLHVEVALLDDDGTIGDRDAEFVDRAFGPEHGVAYEHKGAWRYLLPAATRERGKGRASVAYGELFADDGMAPDSMARSELRLYRLKVRVLARSPAPPPAPPPRDGLSDVKDPAEVMGH